MAHNTQDSLFDEIVVYQEFGVYAHMSYRNHNDFRYFAPRDFLRLLAQHGKTRTHIWNMCLSQERKTVACF